MLLEGPGGPLEALGGQYHNRVAGIRFLEASWGRLGARLGASWGRLGHLGGLWSLSWARLGVVNLSESRSQNLSFVDHFFNQLLN